MSVDADLPVLEVLEAAPDRAVPEEKLEALVVLLYARGLLGSSDGLHVSAPNGVLPAAPDVARVADLALRRRAAVRRDGTYRLTRGAGVLLTERGLLPSQAARDVTRRMIEEDVETILREAATAWPQQ